jgi:methyl-CpG-binding domain protein 2
MNFRTVRSDASLVPPIRQTASIFKQPVTLIKNQEGKVKSDPKQGTQEKPKQLFWEKRLEVCYKKSLKKISNFINVIYLCL